MNRDDEKKGVFEVRLYVSRMKNLKHQEMYALVPASTNV